MVLLDGAGRGTPTPCLASGDDDGAIPRIMLPTDPTDAPAGGTRGCPFAIVGV